MKELVGVSNRRHRKQYRKLTETTKTEEKGWTVVISRDLGLEVLEKKR